jgi:hypothetical protein
VRTKADKEAIKELANDIRRHGLLQPILVWPGAGGRFTIIIRKTIHRLAKKIAPSQAARAALNSLKKLALVASAIAPIGMPLSLAISSATKRTYAG